MKNNKPIQQESSITKKQKQQGKFKYYGSNTEEGIAGNDYWFLNEDPEFQKIFGYFKSVDNKLKQIEHLALMFAEKHGIKHNNSLTSVLSQVLMKCTILLPGETYDGITIGTDKYLRKMSEIDLVLTKEESKTIDKNLLHYYKFENGRIVFDREKYNNENIL